MEPVKKTPDQGLATVSEVLAEFYPDGVGGSSGLFELALRSLTPELHDRGLHIEWTDGDTMHLVQFAQLADVRLQWGLHDMSDEEFETMLLSENPRAGAMTLEIDGCPTRVVHPFGVHDPNGAEAV